MSINVTVSGNPISIRRGKMVLSDLEDIKRTDRERRRRLRMEQVKEQSKAIAKSILNKARGITKEELERLEKDGNTEMHRARDEKLREIIRRYQDIENIGYAHENAARQPDVDSIKQAEEERNKAMAKARGEEAARKLQELNKVVSTSTKRIDRLSKVRELEDQRAHMIAQLPKKSGTDNLYSTDNENFESPTHTSSRKKFKGVVSKKTPIKSVPKTNSKSKMHHVKTPSRISVTINGEDMGSSISDVTEEGNVPESDDNEPRKTIPITRKLKNFSTLSSSDLSSISSMSSHSSNDSSYYSDNASKNTAIRVTPKHHPSPVTSKVSLYDYNTRQQNSYDMPPGLVERVNPQNEQSAEDAAREMRESKKQESAILAAQKRREKQRRQDALRREKVRKDYQELLKKLEELYNEDLKLRAKKISCDMDRQVLAPSKTCQDKVKRQKKMDRVFESILRNSHKSGYCDRPIERPITITPRDQHLQDSSTPITGWKDPPYLDLRESSNSSEDGDEYEVKAKIIDLLMKVEKSRRRLLQEYGDNLPDDIFNIIMKNYVDRPSTSMHQQESTPAHHELHERLECHGHSKPKTSEIQVTGTSDCKGDKSSQKFTSKPLKKPCNKTPARNFIRPCSKNTVSTCDQQVQVELQDITSKDKEEQTKKHPIEPIIKIITPENVNSSSTLSSSTSTATDVVIDVNNQGVTVDHKSRQNSVRIGKEPSVTSVSTGNCKTPVKLSFENKSGFTVTGLLIDDREIRLLTEPAHQVPDDKSEDQSTIVSSGHQSLPGSRKNSPKKLSKSAQPTGHSSPKKSPSRTRVLGRRVPSSYLQQHYKTQYTQVSIDSSTESSQFNLTPDTANGKKLYTQFQTLAARRVVTTTTSNGRNGRNRQHQETSDASTTYASPPAPAACAMLNAMNSSTPILELLESSSANEVIRRKARQVSPVSSPETPSPRTMKLPSNIPRPSSRASRNLKLLLDARSRLASSTTEYKSTRTNSGTNNNSSGVKIQTTSPRVRQPCTCKNPMCKLFHEKVEDQPTYNLTHCPETLQTFEDLQNVYTERIHTLSDLIELVRNEQKGLELSVMTTSENSKLTSRSDSTSQPPGSGSLIKNIEAIHAQLKKALEESRKIISSDDIELPKSTKHVKINEKSPSTTIDLSKETINSESLEDEAKEEPPQHSTPTGPPKPRIVSEQRVNIPLGRFQYLQKPRFSTNNDKNKSTATSITAEVADADVDQSEQMVQMLSKELLEQSKSVNKSTPVDNLKDSDDSILKKSEATAVKDSGDSNENGVSTDEQNQSENFDTSNSDYVPFLAGIPKVTRTKNSTSGRGRPPVTLISGPYRPEIVTVSPAHELSTIVEFDTPDTVSKSQVSMRSPSNKARRKLVPHGEATVSSTPSKNVDTNTSKNKPSLQVAPFPMRQPSKFPLNASNKSMTKSNNKSPKKSLEKSPSRSIEKSPKKSIDKSSQKCTDNTLASLENARAAKDEVEKHISSESMHSLPEESNYEFRVSQISELHSLPDETIDRMLISEVCDDSKSKSVTPEQRKIQQQHREQVQEQENAQLTLTSTASLSAISGVSEISSTPSSDAQRFKCPSSSDEMELALKKWGLGSWVPTLKKNREASALGSSSSSDVTPVNIGSRLITSVRRESTPRELLLAEISDVSSISIKNENKSTERSVLGKAGRTSTPNRHLLRNNSNEGVPDRNVVSSHSKRLSQSHRSVNINCSNSSNSNASVSLSSFSSDINIVVQNQSAESIPHISFSNNNLG
ncbi:uncharacterized protein LOC106638343 isoform X2 [Copidosoma floridanum]|uniref:uncharacterized protein LOC106638343 isoform X2 n=1 Tax=Copidosoma floridanum TaxID=29053 RepID=UPI0006C9AC9F|nr:uncharacterized protein LOC106638343 isoform X2 [Copidosoma floridanum]